ncbi:MAG: hypothetical protein HY347_11045 [candidate division NC10 bacterium]|nr:hypothetical protein [candidate division NC10 bacterium]
MGFRKAFADLKRFSSKTFQAFRGFIIIIAFTDRGRMRRFRLKKSLLIFSAFVVLASIFGSALSFLGVFQGSYERARLVSLEAENRSLVSLLEGQAEQLSKLRQELDRLKELERSLRAVAGFGPPSPGVGRKAGQVPLGRE